MNHITSIGLDVHARSVTAVAACQGTGMIAYSEWRGGLFRAPHLF